MLQPDPNQHVVLLAEDEPVVRLVATSVLRSAGYFVLAACSGLEALQLSDQFPGPIHLLLSDIRMPGMDGFELAEQVRGTRPGTRVLFMSGLSNQNTGPYLEKPFTKRVMLDTVDAVLRGGNSFVAAR